MNSAALEIIRLSLGPRHQPILADLSLIVEPGGKLTLTGPSGCGKTTLLRSLMGFVEPARGTIRIFGEELDAESCWRLRRRMTLVDQEPDLGEGTVIKALQQPFAYKANQHLRPNLDLLPHWLEQLRLPDSVLTKETARLSGGEKQRIALLSALLLERDILLLDEPSSALDHATAAAVALLLSQRKQQTIIAISHERIWLDHFPRRFDLGTHAQGLVA